MTATLTATATDAPATGPALGLTRDYTRRPAVETEIRALPVAGPALVNALYGAVANETLVHGIRRLRAAGDTSGADRIMNLLIERVSGLVAAVAYSQAQVAEDREDVAQATYIQMCHEITDSRPQYEFWEVHFNHMVRLACGDAAEKLRAARRHERPFHAATNDDGDTWSEESTLAAPDTIEDNATVNEALAQLDGPIRKAFELKMQGYKEKSNDTTETTICTILGVSDRSVRNYLRAAELTLQAWWNRGLAESAA